jgi:hypothetical protein
MPARRGPFRKAEDQGSGDFIPHIGSGAVHDFPPAYRRGMPYEVLRSVVAF